MKLTKTVTPILNYILNPALKPALNPALNLALSSAIALVGAIGAIGLPLSGAPAHAQTATATTPGAIAQVSEERIGRVNPAQPIRIEIINGGDLTIAAALVQPASAERQIAPDSQTAFGSTTTSYLPLPINLIVYPQGDGIGLSVDVLVEGNVITVIVSEQLSGDSGALSLSVDENGNVLLI
jgi:hypothetical protein